MQRMALVASGFLWLSSMAAYADAPKAGGKGEAKKGEAPRAEKRTGAKAAPAARARADIKAADGRSIGTAKLEQTPHGVLITLELASAPAGTHAFHIHETGKCDAPFKSAGGHFNPAGHEHGFKNPEGAHAGDLPNITIPEGGKGSYQFFASGVTLEPGAKNSLLDADGAALVLHKGADDYAEPVAGNAGERIACGVIEPVR